MPLYLSVQQALTGSLSEKRCFVWHPFKNGQFVSFKNDISSEDHFLCNHPLTPSASVLSLPSPSCYTSYSPSSLFVIRSPDTFLTVQLWGCVCISLCLWWWLEHILHLSYQRYVSLLNWEFKCVCVFLCVCVCVCVCVKGFWACLCVLHSNLARVCVCVIGGCARVL